MTPDALLRSLRARLNLTQSEMAERLGCSLRTIQHWERENGHGPGAATLLELARIADVAIQVDAGGWHVVEVRR